MCPFVYTLAGWQRRRISPYWELRWLGYIHISHVLLSRTSCGRLPRRLFSALSKTIRGAPEMTFGNTILKFQFFKAKALKTLNLEYQHMNMNIDPNQWPSIAADRRAFWILT